MLTKSPKVRRVAARLPVPPPLKWHGGKHYLAQRIIAMMPPHTHYVEPYAGGLSVLLAKDPEGVSEVANDVNAWLATFWGVLRDPQLFDAFARRCAATEFSEGMFRASVSRTQPDDLTGPVVGDPVEAAWRFFCRCRMSYAGRMRHFTARTRSRTRGGMNAECSAWINTVDGLPAVHARLRRVLVLGSDAPDVIRAEDSPHTLFYLDPPYLHETRATTADYAHEMTAEQHERVLGVLAGIKGRFLLSGYDSPLYRRLEARHRWSRVEFDLPNNSAAGETKRRMTEVVWANYRLATAKGAA